MAKLEARYEEQKIIHVKKTKKQSEQLEVLVNVLNEVKVSLNERIVNMEKRMIQNQYQSILHLTQKNQ